MTTRDAELGRLPGSEARTLSRKMSQFLSRAYHVESPVHSTKGLLLQHMTPAGLRELQLSSLPEFQIWTLEKTPIPIWCSSYHHGFGAGKVWLCWTLHRGNHQQKVALPVPGAPSLSVRRDRQHGQIACSIRLTRSVRE